MVRTFLNGAERQTIPAMIFSAQELVRENSHEMTLLPGDLIACGSSVDIGGMIFTVIDDPGYRMSPSFSRRAFVERYGTADVLFRE